MVVDLIITLTPVSCICLRYSKFEILRVTLSSGSLRLNSEYSLVDFGRGVWIVCKKGEDDGMGIYIH